MVIPSSIRCVLISFAVAFLAMLSSSVDAQQPWTRHTIDQSSKGADGVRLADFDGDGLLDIVTGWEQGGIVRVYKNPGPAAAKNAWPAVTVGPAPSVEDAVFVDLDRDGNLDVVSCCEGKTRQVRIHWAPAMDQYLDETKWKTDTFPSTDQQSCWMFCLPMEVDGKNGIDLVVGSKQPNGQVGWLESPDAGSGGTLRDLGTWKYHHWQDAGWIMSLRSWDMDGDGDQDVLVSDRKGDRRGVYWLENQNDKAVEQVWNRRDVGGNDCECMFLDVTESQRKNPLIVCATRNGELLRFDGPNSLPAIPNPFKVEAGKAAAWGDMNLDGQLDIVHTTNTGSMKTKVAGVGLMLGSVQTIESIPSDAGLSWAAQAISNFEGIKFDRIELLDLDGDGDLDVLTCEERDNLGVIWYENPIRQP